MALNGDFTGTTGNSSTTAKIVWSAVQSITGNYSDVTATLYYSKSTASSQTTKGNWSGGITIDGVRTSGSKYISLPPNNSSVVAMTATTRVSHNDNGTKVMTISADGIVSGTTLNGTSISKSIVLDTIKRVSQATLSASSVDFGGSVKITTNRPSTNYTHKLYYKYGNSGWIPITPTPSVTTEYTWTVPVELADQIPNTTSLDITVSCDTYLGDAYLGEYHMALKATVPTEGGFPSIDSISWKRAEDTKEPSSWPLTQNVSKGTLKMNGVKGAYGSIIKTYSLTFAGYSSTSDSLDVPSISSSGNLEVVASVTDSRGRIFTSRAYFSVAAYSPPQVVVRDVYRCTEGGSEDTSGNYIGVEAGVNFTAIGSGDDANGVTDFWFKYKKTTDSTYKSEFIDSSAPMTIVEASSDNTWDWIIVASDKVSTVSVSGTTSTGEVVLDILANGRGISFLKVAEKEGVGAAGDIETDGKIMSVKSSTRSVQLTNDDSKGCNIFFSNNGAWGYLYLTEDGKFMKCINGGIYDLGLSSGEADYVVAQGTSGIWTYRKWNSGIAECWGEGTFTINGWNAWGALYESTNTFQATYPANLFTATPVVNISVSRTDPNNNIGTCGLEIFSGASKTQTPVCYALRPGTGATGNIYLAITARGKWK